MGGSCPPLQLLHVLELRVDPSVPEVERNFSLVHHPVELTFGDLHRSSEIVHMIRAKTLSLGVAPEKRTLTVKTVMSPSLYECSIFRQRQSYRKQKQADRDH